MQKTEHIQIHFELIFDMFCLVLQYKGIWSSAVLKNWKTILVYHVLELVSKLSVTVKYADLKKLINRESFR